MDTTFLYEHNNFQCFTANKVGSFKNMHNEIELMYVYEGKVKAYYNLSEYTLSAGDLIIIFPNIIHSFEIIEDSAHLLAIFDKTIFPSFLQTFTAKCVSGAPIVSLSNLPPDTSFCLEQIVNNKELQQKSNITEGYLMVVLERMLSNLTLSDLSEEKNTEWIHLSLKYLNDNYTQNITLENMAKDLMVSKYHLSRKFNARIGFSIFEYINRLRVQKAISLIESSDMLIIDIAYECGFDSLSTFFRVFKKITDKSPKTYREQTLIH